MKIINKKYTSMVSIYSQAGIFNLGELQETDLKLRRILRCT